MLSILWKKITGIRCWWAQELLSSTPKATLEPDWKYNLPVAVHIQSQENYLIFRQEWAAQNAKLLGRLLPAFWLPHQLLHSPGTRPPLWHEHDGVFIMFLKLNNTCRKYWVNLNSAASFVCIYFQHWSTLNNNTPSSWKKAERIAGYCINIRWNYMLYCQPSQKTPKWKCGRFL